MGYDCTLHAVDEKQISEQFVDTLLNRCKAEDHARDEDDDEEELWNQVVDSLAEDSDDDAGSLVCQMALVFASKSHPYHSERGFALCLWPEQSKDLRACLPEEFTDPPDVLFELLVKEYPQLRGQFPRDFSGNWSTGTFISSHKVPAALRWVEKKVAEFAEGHRKLFRGLLLVLRHCERNKLAYWEGTDLPLPMAEVLPEGAKALRASRAFIWPDHGYLPVARHGDHFVCESYLGMGAKDARTALADFSVWPPAVDWLPEFAFCADVSPTGSLVTIGCAPGTYDYTLRLRASGSPDVQLKEFTVAGSDSNTMGYAWCGFLGEQVVSLLNFEKGKVRARYPLFQQGALLVEDKSFRPARDRHGDPSWWTTLFRRRYVSDSELIRVGFARTGSGAQVFIWGESGYERVGNGFKETFHLGPSLGASDWTSVPAGDDGFFYVSGDYNPVKTKRPALWEIRRGAAPVPHLTRITNIMEIRPGPEGSLLIREGMNKTGDWGKLYWPQTREVVRLKPALLPDVNLDPRALHWLEARQTLLAFAPAEVWPIPWADLEKLPRIRAE